MGQNTKISLCLILLLILDMHWQNVAGFKTDNNSQPDQDRGSFGLILLTLRSCIFSSNSNMRYQNRIDNKSSLCAWMDISLLHQFKMNGRYPHRNITKQV